MKLYIEKREAKNSKKEYVALVADFGYRAIPISFDYQVLCDCLGLYGADYYEETGAMKVGDRILVKQD